MKNKTGGWYGRFMRWAEGEDPDQYRELDRDPALAEFQEYLEYLDSHEYIEIGEYRALRRRELANRGLAAPAPEEEKKAPAPGEAPPAREKLWERPGTLLWLYRLLSVAVAAAVLCFFVSVALELPAFGSPDAPALNEVARRYLEKGVEETGAVNAVAGLILDYRAFDTFGESTVLFAASMSVVLLLRRPEERKRRPAAPWSPILRMVGSVILPAVMMYGCYVVLNGHLSPGGGFSGGTVLGCGLILASMVMGQERLEKVLTGGRITGLTVGCLLTYGLLKGYSFFTGANHVGWEVPKGTPGDIFSAGFILPLNICVGVIVACTMYTFFDLFSRREEE